MSGGHFDYMQYHIRQIADDIENVIVKNKVEIPKEKLDKYAYNEDGTIDDWNKYYYCFPEDVIEKFKEGYWKLREAEIYAQRTDYLLSDDDGEDSFRKRLNEDLEELRVEKENKSWEYNKEDYE